jgi:hypothetical protein
MHRLALKLVLLALLLLASAAPARAETVLFACSESCPLALFEALELELRGHGAFLVSRLSPAGVSVEAHERDARRMAGLTPAAAVLWIEREAPLRVRVLSPREPSVREAPLSAPPEQIEARLFAAIAGSVVLQALGAPGHEQGATAPAPAPASQSAPPPLPPPAFATNAGPVKRQARTPRFFLRAGAALGLAFARSGMSADRPPPQPFVQEAFQKQIATGSVEAGREALAAHGYDCDWSAKPGGTGGMVAANCEVAIKAPGLAFVPGIDLSAGWYIMPRFALSTFVRITPKAGAMAILRHAVLGAQAEYALTAPQERGFWANVGFGMGGGRIQVRPPSGSGSAHRPYATSGLGEAHALLALGYRFSPNFGLYATPTVRLLFPDKLWMLDPALGVEGRL